MDGANLVAADLATIAGASVAAITFTQFLKALLNLGPAATRGLSMVVGLIVVVGVTILTGIDGLGMAELILTLFLAVLVGMQAGMAASKFFETLTEGFGHTVEEA